MAPLRAPDRPEPVVSVGRPLAIDQLQHAAERRPDVFLAGSADLQAIVAEGGG